MSISICLNVYMFIRIFRNGLEDIFGSEAAAYVIFIVGFIEGCDYELLSSIPFVHNLMYLTYEKHIHIQISWIHISLWYALYFEYKIIRNIIQIGWYWYVATLVSSTNFTGHFY